MYALVELGISSGSWSKFLQGLLVAFATEVAEAIAVVLVHGDNHAEVGVAVGVVEVEVEVDIEADVDAERRGQRREMWI